MRAVRALRHHDAHPLREALTIVSFLKGKISLEGEVARDWFPCEGIRSRLADFAAELAASDIRGQVEEVLRGDMEGGELKRRRVSTLVKLALAWRKRRASSAINAVFDGEGRVVTRDDEVAKVLRTHWQKAFSQKASRPDLIRGFLEQWMPKFPVFEADISLEAVETCISRIGKTAPGPDGVAYSCWRRCPSWRGGLLHTCIGLWLDGSDLPEGFNHAYLALLPKSKEDILKAEDTRLLSLGNTDAKVFASCLRWAIQPAALEFVSPEQTGFLEGRSMAKNIVDVEERLILTSATSGARSPVAVFFDFALAFPSLAHEFMWVALEVAGFPDKVISAIRGLYDDNKHWRRAGKYFLGET